MLDANANQEWAAERTINEYGQMLYPGDVYDMVLLYPHGWINLSGPGEDHIDFELIKPGGLMANLLRISVVDTPPEIQSLQVRVEYDNDVVQITNFLIGIHHQVFLPLVQSDRSGLSAAGTPPHTGGAQRMGAPTGPSQDPWQGYWTWAAPNRNDQQTAFDSQRWYRQLRPHEWRNTTGCASGCGATAWAMLFGWADYRASINDPVWWHRKGLYRQAGGTYPTASIHTVAPLTMGNWEPELLGTKDALWELRNVHLGTYCVGDQGATNPWDMYKASRYLTNRSGARVTVQQDNLGIPREYIRDSAVYTILARGAPSIVNIGWFLGGHYPLAYGYHWRVREYCTWNLLPPGYYCTMYDNYTLAVNQGHNGEMGGKWYPIVAYVPGSIWLAGQVWPQ